MTSFLIDDSMMRSGLNLKGCELLLFALISSFSRKGLTMNESEQFLSEHFSYSRVQIGKALCSLVAKGYVIRSGIKHPHRQSYDYSVNVTKVQEILASRCEESLQLDAVYRTRGKIRLLGKLDSTNLDIALYSYRGGTRVDIILATPENDLYAVPFDSRVGQDGMSEVATFAKSRTASPNSRLGSALTKTIRLADLVMARHASSRGGSWSGKSGLSDAEKQTLSDAGRSGALSATLEDLRYVEKIK